MKLMLHLLLLTATFVTRLALGKVFDYQQIQSIDEPPEFELVIARYTENKTALAWIGNVQPFYKITIINKGGSDYPMPELPIGREYDIVNDQNDEVGREGDSFAGHLVRRYDSLAAYTIFSQAGCSLMYRAPRFVFRLGEERKFSGNPFPHNEYYLELLRSPAMLGKVQTMSRLYLASGKYETPKAAVDAMSKHPYYRSERFSFRTLNSVWYHDEGSLNVLYEYCRAHNLQFGDNLMAHHFKLIGLEGWIPESQEVGSFSFGALVGFDRSTALQHPKTVYERLKESTHGTWSNNFIVERMWIMLFGGSNFKDV